MWRVDDVHGRGLRDSLSPCGMSPRISRLHVLATSPKLPELEVGSWKSGVGSRSPSRR